MPTFILNDETKKNSHGFFLLNTGGRFDRFRDNPAMLNNHNLDELVGRWNNLRVEGSQLMADPEFDEGDELAVKLRGKVERGYLKGASPGIIILSAEWRYCEQTGREELYVTEWELFEGSVTSVPSNAGAIALRIYTGDGHLVADNDVKLHIDGIVKLSAESRPAGADSNKNHMDKITLSAEALVALGINENAEASAVSAAIVKLQADYKAQGDKLAGLERKAKEQATKAATDLIRMAAKTGQITADKENELIPLAVEHPDIVQTVLAAVPAKQNLSAQVQPITGAMVPQDRAGWTHLRWLKEDPTGLEKIKTSDPAAFEKIKQIRNN